MALQRQPAQTHHSENKLQVRSTSSPNSTPVECLFSNFSSAVGSTSVVPRVPFWRAFEKQIAGSGHPFDLAHKRRSQRTSGDRCPLCYTHGFSILSVPHTTYCLEGLACVVIYLFCIGWTSHRVAHPCFPSVRPTLDIVQQLLLSWAHYKRMK